MRRKESLPKNQLDSQQEKAAQKKIDTTGEQKEHPVRKRGLSREADNPKRCKVSTPNGFANMNKLQRWLDSKERLGSCPSCLEYMNACLRC